MILTLKQFRILSNMTQKEIAQKLRISTTTWNSYERGLSYPPIKTIESIESFFNIWQIL